MCLGRSVAARDLRISNFERGHVLADLVLEPSFKNALAPWCKRT